MGPKTNGRTIAAFAAGTVMTLTTGFVLQSWNAGAWPGDTDTTFVPIAPCRLFDTRPEREYHIGPHGSFAANDTKTISARGSHGQCNLPADAVGLSMNVTAVGATQHTYLTIWGSGQRPTASSLNPAPGQPATPNAVVTPLSNSGAFQVYNLAGNVNVLADVNGYYTKSSLKDLDLWTSDLYLAQPFVVTSRLNDYPGWPLGGPPGAIAGVTIDAPHDGQVTVTASVVFDSWDPDGGEMAECFIAESANLPTDPPHLPHASDESYQVLQAPAGQPMTGSLLLTRTFPIAQDATAEYVVVCSFYPMALPGIGVSAADMTALFTPTY